MNLLMFTWVALINDLFNEENGKPGYSYNHQNFETKSRRDVRDVKVVFEEYDRQEISNCCCHKNKYHFVVDLVYFTKHVE